MGEAYRLMMEVEAKGIREEYAKHGLSVPPEVEKMLQDFVDLDVDRLLGFPIESRPEGGPEGKS